MAHSGPKGFYNFGINSCKGWCETDHHNQTLSIILVRWMMEIFQCHDWHDFPPPKPTFIRFNLPLSWCTHLKHTPDLISMRQYANRLDLLVSVSFISPGFLSAPLHTVPSLLFFLSWQRLHAQINSVNSSTVEQATAVHVFLCLCVPADVCAILISSRRGNTLL